MAVKGTRRKVGVLISGRGSNLRALIDATSDPAYPAEIVTVIANVPGAKGLEHAARAGITSHTIDHRGFARREDFEAEMTRVLDESGVELVCQAGFMRIVTAGFVGHWHDRMVNIHPSLLPLFPGLDTHARALAAGLKLAGCTVHFVREAVDQGPIIGQAAVPILPGDSPEILAGRVLKAEHRLYPACLRLVAEGRVQVIGDVARVDSAEAAGSMLFNPPPD